MTNAPTPTFRHLQAVREGEHAIDQRIDPSTDRGAWQHARWVAHRDHLLDVMGVDDLDQLDTDEHTYLGWLAGWDAETVAGIARLMSIAKKAPV